MKNLIRQFRKVFSFILIGCLLASCISQKSVTLLKDDQGKPQTSFSNKKKSTYQLQTGDQLYIKIYSLDPKTAKFFQADLPTLMNPTYLYLNSYMVDEEGYINFSFIERMMVKGLTLEEVKKKIQKTLNDYFKETTVTVKLVNFQISVMGEVSSPGTFSIDKEQVNVLQAISMAGGFKTFGNNKKVTLVRQTLTGSDVYYLDLSSKKILESDNFFLMPHDIIYVAPRTAKTYLVETFPIWNILSIASFAVSTLVLVKVL
jgi:polysaccharide export outer membrane protein